LSTNYESVKNWIVNSGLIISDNQDSNFGAVYSYFDESKKTYSFLYPEITGYCASACSFLYTLEKNNDYLKLADASSKWLIKLFENYGAIVQGIEYSNSKRKKLAYSFDTAICAKGLLDCYNITNDPIILEYTKKFINWMLESLEDDGTLMPFMEIENKKFSQSDDVWYKQKSCLHIKTAMPLLQLFSITKDSEFLQKAEQICDTYPKFQLENGSYSIHEGTNVINLHTQSYALEGLLFAYNFTKKKEYLKSVRKALDWCVSNIENDGSISLWFNFKDKSKAVYPIAQVIRLLILMDKILKEEKYKSYTDKLVQFMTSLQAQNSDHRINGGFYEEFYKSMFGWKKRLKLNSWGSLFALQALHWYDNYDKIDFENSILTLY